MILLRRQNGDKLTPAMGGHPDIPKAVPQNIPTLKMPTARGWQGDEKPVAAPGLKVNAFARDLLHPRWIEVLPNGDVLVAEALQEVLGTDFARVYATVKENENREFLQVISPWEREHLLLNV